MDPYLLLHHWGAHVWGILILGAVGLLLLLLGLIRLRRPSAGRKLLSLLFVITGLALVSFAGLVIFKRPQAFEQLLQQDFDDPAKLAQLQKDSLDSRQSVPAAPGEWPQWRGPHRDGVSAETGLRTDWTDPPPILWTRPLGGGYSSLAVADGRVYTQDRQGEEERVICVDAMTGKDVWIHHYPVSYAGFVSHAAGPRATPTVYDGRVYTVGATGIFLCLEANVDTHQAKILWQHDLLQECKARLPDWGVACSPLIEGDLVIVQPGGSGGSVAAIDRRSGELIWKALSEESGYSSPVAATAAGVRQIVCFTGLGITGLRPATGEQLWYYRWPTQYHANIATPIVAGDYVFLSSNYGAGCALLRLSPGEAGVKAEPVYVKHNKLMRNHHSSCVLHDGHMYGFDVGLGVLKCVDLRTAEEKWTTRNLTTGSLLLADDRLIILSQDGTLSQVEATPTGFRSRGQWHGVVQGSDCWALPALAGGRLYLRDHQQLVCVDVRSVQ